MFLIFNHEFPLNLVLHLLHVIVIFPAFLGTLSFWEQFGHTKTLQFLLLSAFFLSLKNFCFKTNSVFSNAANSLFRLNLFLEKALHKAYPIIAMPKNLKCISNKNKAPIIIKYFDSASKLYFKKIHSFNQYINIKSFHKKLNLHLIWIFVKLF